MKAWMRLMPGGERGPVPEEAVFYAAERYFREGKLYHGMIALLSMDAYLRSQDWASLTGADVSTDRRSTAIVFGVSSRGESSKGGCNQGVVIARGFLAEAMAALASVVDPSSAIFPMTTRKFRLSWQELWKTEGVTSTRSNHELRHTGASEDIARGRRDREGVRRRGRWKAVSSCDRYTKSHLLVTARQEFGEKVVQRGAAVMTRPREILSRALQKGGASSTREGQAVLARWSNGPTIPDAVESVRPGVESPRIEPMRNLKVMPGQKIINELQAKRLPVSASRAQNIQTLKTHRFAPGVAGAWLDSGDDTVGSCGEEEEEEELDSEDEDEVVDEEALARSGRHAGRRKTRLTARANAMRNA
jgi:hypothetical protein